MARPLLGHRTPRKGWRLALALAAGFLTAGGGCASGIYQAANLPAELVAPPVDNIKNLNLARLGGYASGGERIERGDLLEVTIVTDVQSVATMTNPVRVAADGTAHVPLVGVVPLAGLEMEEAERLIAATAIQNGIYRNPHVTVTMKEQRTNRVTVMGAVEEPGVYRLPRGASYLLSAIVAAGGLTEDAAADVEIRRSQPAGVQPQTPPPRVAGESGAQLTSYHEATAGQTPWVRVNLVSAVKEGNGAYYLEDGDVLMIPRQTPRPIHVLGLVNKPGKYDMPFNEDLHVLDALALAGGRTTEFADKVWILRRLPGQQAPCRIQVSVRDAKRNDAANVRLAPGDVISVEQTPVTVVWDMLRSFFRFSVGSTVAMF